MRALFILIIPAAISSACGDADFDSPIMVTDLRVLGMQAEPPEVIVDIDLQNPDLGQLDVPPVTFTVLVADPGADRRLTWTMTACPRHRDGLCLGDASDTVFASGTVDDPETLGAAPIMATLDPGLPLLMEAYELDELHGAAGVPIHVLLTIQPEGSDEIVYAYKTERYTPRIPPEREANRNPVIEDLLFAEASVPAGRCSDPTATPLTVAPGEEVELTPVPTPESFETFVLPTTDGDVREFTESLEYSWYITAGDLSDGETGGSNPIDPMPPVENLWTAPDTTGPVTLWLVQRDRRGGMSWIERCLVVQ